MTITKQQAIAEIARRVQEEKADFYTPHSGQLAFHKSQAKIRGIFAGNRFGKTWCGMMELYWHVTKQHPYRPPLSRGAVTARACCVNFQTMQKSMVDDTAKKMIPRKYLRGESWDTAYSERNKTLYFKDGGFIEFMSYDQDVEAYGAVARHVIWEDEEAPEDIHGENLALRAFNKGILFITMTPVRPSMWVISDVFEKAEADPNIEVFAGDSTDNPYVDQETVQFMYSQISDPVERHARMTGEFTWYAGKIYPDYGDPHRIEKFVPPQDWLLVVAIDPHDTKETAVTFSWWSPDRKVYFLDELWVGGSVDHIVGEIKGRCVYWRKTPDAILIDPSSDRDPKIHDTESIYRKFQKPFPDISKWLSHSGSVWTGVEDVRDMLKINVISNLPRLFVCPEMCPMTDWQMSHWGLKPPSQADKVRYNPQPIKVKDDFADCVRGTIMHGYPDWAIRSMSRPQEDDLFGVRSFDG